MNHYKQALKYATFGWSVLPVWWPKNGQCACGTSNCPSPGKHPLGAVVTHGVKEATTDPEIIKAWWRHFTQANVGIATGPASGLLVLDLDPRNGGHPKRLPGPVPETPVARTGGGGWHIMLKWPGPVFQSPAKLPGVPGVDIKASGGYVVAPPSTHVSGRGYAWIQPPDQVPLAPCPDWLLETLGTAQTPKPAKILPPMVGGALGTPYGRAALRNELSRLALTPQGKRNNALNRAAFVLGRLVAADHLDEGMVAGLLTIIGLDTGLGCRETEKTIWSGLSAGLRQGRS